MILENYYCSENYSNLEEVNLNLWSFGLKNWKSCYHVKNDVVCCNFDFVVIGVGGVDVEEKMCFRN